AHAPDRRVGLVVDRVAGRRARIRAGLAAELERARFLAGVARRVVRPHRTGADHVIADELLAALSAVARAHHAFVAAHAAVVEIGLGVGARAVAIDLAHLTAFSSNAKRAHAVVAAHAAVLVVFLQIEAAVRKTRRLGHRARDVAHAVRARPHPAALERARV